MASSHCFFLLCPALLVAMAAAAQLRVGGPTGWAVPTGPDSTSYNQWAGKNRVRVGDSILFVYPPDRDSVLQVNQDAYNTCNTSDYIQRFDDGNTVFAFNRLGPYYFISGHESNCLRNESMVVVVVADQNNRSSGSSVRPEVPLTTPPTGPLPTSPPSNITSPSEVPPPPAEEATPLPPPSTAEVPPPPAEEVLPPPPPAPTGEESGAPPPLPNAAALKVVGFMSSVGTLLGSLLFMF